MSILASAEPTDTEDVWVRLKANESSDYSYIGLSKVLLINFTSYKLKMTLSNTDLTYWAKNDKTYRRWQEADGTPTTPTLPS